ncbi:hypothetical protein C8Q77DRAFT_1124774 [Trametes polyzona]|nr:hypothetical protein C8Q77DRAFT_1124774 [Trametes polyzona]
MQWMAAPPRFLVMSPCWDISVPRVHPSQPHRTHANGDASDGARRSAFGLHKFTPRRSLRLATYVHVPWISGSMRSSEGCCKRHLRRNSPYPFPRDPCAIPSRGLLARSLAVSTARPFALGSAASHASAASGCHVRQPECTRPGAITAWRPSRSFLGIPADTPCGRARAGRRSCGACLTRSRAEAANNPCYVQGPGRAGCSGAVRPVRAGHEAAGLNGPRAGGSGGRVAGRRGPGAVVRMGEGGSSTVRSLETFRSASWAGGLEMNG